MTIEDALNLLDWLDAGKAIDKTRLSEAITLIREKVKSDNHRIGALQAVNNKMRRTRETQVTVRQVLDGMTIQVDGKDLGVVIHTSNSEPVGEVLDGWDVNTQAVAVKVLKETADEIASKLFNEKSKKK